MSMFPKARVRPTHTPKPPCKKCGYREPPPKRLWIVSHGVDIPESMMKKAKLKPGCKLDKVMYVSDEELQIDLHTTNLPDGHPMEGKWHFVIPFKEIARYMEGPWTEWEKMQPAKRKKAG